ncbi:MAG: hypothetical protein ABFS18_12650 [Thermodesulfobacteriota bacterium]
MDGWQISREIRQWRESSDDIRRQKGSLPTIAMSARPLSWRAGEMSEGRDERLDGKTAEYEDSGRNYWGNGLLLRIGTEMNKYSARFKVW